MAGLVRTRAKRVTYPLDDKVKAESYFSSGSDYFAAVADEDDVRPSLSKLVSSFLEEEEASTSESTKHNDDGEDGEESASDRSAALKSILRSAKADAYAKVLLADVADACLCFSGGSGSDDMSATRRSVVSFLRSKGNHAAICKTKWSSAGGITAGQYEFIDVVPNHPSARATWQQQSKRYFVDVDFAAEFEIARPSGQYTRLKRLLPRHYVGGGDELKKIVRVMSEAAKKSLRSQELSVPPWRKNRYMQNKWFGPYNRTINPTLSAENQITRTSSLFPSAAKCRWVGFDDVVSEANVVAAGRIYIHDAAMTDLLLGGRLLLEEGLKKLHEIDEKLLHYMLAISQFPLDL